ncbi:MAG: hypothetical protein LVQ63_00555 [Thermoplasmatales archaeon]|nr:hypothetical protein [Thermoplasmatales archaeon]
MPEIISSDGFYSGVRFQMKRFDSLGTAYLTGNFNCWGEGSIVLSSRSCYLPRSSFLQVCTDIQYS